MTAAVDALTSSCARLLQRLDETRRMRQWRRDAWRHW